MFRTYRKAARAALVAAAGAAMVLAGTQSAHADGTGESLMPDPSAWCENNLPFQAQIADVGWQVTFLGLSGSASQNDWGCRYAVSVVIPTGEDGFTLPPANDTVPIDWAAMCAQQYDGSSLEWVGVKGPLTSAPGPYGAPWLCRGAAGATYDQAETENGPVGRTG